MLSGERRQQLVQWLEMNWDTRTPEQRRQLLAMRPEVVGAFAGHEALGGYTRDENGDVLELAERFFRSKRGGQNIIVGA